jgi:hypothetical protein
MTLTMVMDVHRYGFDVILRLHILRLRHARQTIVWMVPTKLHDYVSLYVFAPAMVWYLYEARALRTFPQKAKKQIRKASSNTTSKDETDSRSLVNMGPWMGRSDTATASYSALTQFNLAPQKSRKLRRKRRVKMIPKQ